MDTYKLNNLEELKYSISIGLDVEFFLRDVRYDISWSDCKPFICTCPDGDAVFYKDADDLLKNYKIDGLSLSELWQEIDIYSM